MGKNKHGNPTSFCKQCDSVERDVCVELLSISIQFVQETEGRFCFLNMGGTSCNNIGAKLVKKVLITEDECLSD